MSKETIPQSIIDKINGKYPESNSNSNQGLTEDINRLIALFREAAIWGAFELDKWISVKDGLPEYGVKVLVFGEARGANPSMGGAYIFITHRIDLKGTLLEKNKERHQDENQFAAAYVTHYQYLPKPPKDI